MDETPWKDRVKQVLVPRPEHLKRVRPFIDTDLVEMMICQRRRVATPLGAELMRRAYTVTVDESRAQDGPCSSMSRRIVGACGGQVRCLCGNPDSFPRLIVQRDMSREAFTTTMS